MLAAAGPRLAELQREARGVMAGLKRFSALALVLPVVFFGGFFLRAPVGLVFLAFIIVGAVIVTATVRAASRVYQARSKVMEAIAPALGMTFSARPSERIDLSGFEGTYYGQLFRYVRVQDVLAGRRGEAAFEIFDAVLTARSKGPDGAWRSGEPPKRLENVAFQITRVVRVEVPGRWTSRTVVARDAGVANRLQQPKGMERVRLVDSRFEKTFEVFSTDQTEARALLHPAFMERLQELEELFRDAEKPALAVFDGAAFFVALPLTPSEDESTRLAKSKASAVDQFVVDRILWEIDAVLGVVEAAVGPEAHEGPPAT